LKNSFESRLQADIRLEQPPEGGTQNSKQFFWSLYENLL